MSTSFIYDTLNSLLNNQLQYFRKDQSHQSANLLLKKLMKIQEDVIHIEPLAKDFIATSAHKYDVVPGLEANGYRSLLTVLECFLSTLVQTLRNIEAKRDKVFFRGNEYLDKLELFSDILHQLRALLYYAQVMIGLTPDGNLFLSEDKSAPIMHDCEIMAKACFYGSLHGFQYSKNLQPLVHSLSTFVAQYNELQETSDTWTWVKSAISSGRYLVSPELRGEKLEQVYNGSDVVFFKRFWSLREYGVAQQVPNIVGVSVQVNRVFKIPLESLTLPSTKSDCETIEIVPPQTLVDCACINARLISATLRENQDDSSSPSNPDAGFDKSKILANSSTTKSKSKNLIFFCHGGGFIALTSKSYELVLRDWANELDCPIFCVDYSLAPDSPFPKAFEECYYAYAWALKNCHLLGSTAERVMFVGDSAGGNLVLSVALRAGVEGLRIPDHLLVLYPACVVSFCASPARLMSVMDPLLPLGVLSACLRAYSGVKPENESHYSLDVEASRTPPSMQPVRIKYISNLLKDVEQGLSKISNQSRQTTTSTNSHSEDFSSFHDLLNLRRISDDDNSRSSDDDSALLNFVTPGKTPSKTSAKNLQSSMNLSGKKFLLKLPHNFQPLKSKFCGSNLKTSHLMRSESVFLSPALVDDKMLMNLPYIDIVGCEFDPLFDDSIFLAKRLESIKKPYKLHVAKRLPHGFLNCKLADDTKEAAVMCLNLLKENLLSSTS